MSHVVSWVLTPLPSPLGDTMGQEAFLWLWVEPPWRTVDVSKVELFLLPSLVHLNILCHSTTMWELLHWKSELPARAQLSVAACLRLFSRGSWAMAKGSCLQLMGHCRIHIQGLYPYSSLREWSLNPLMYCAGSHWQRHFCLWIDD